MLIHVKRFYPFALNLFLIPPRGEIVVIITQIGKTLIDLTNLVKSIIVLLSVRFLLFILYSVFNDHNSRQFAGGGLNASLRDLARVGEMLRNNGMWRGVRIIPAEAVEEMTAGEYDLSLFTCAPNRSQRITVRCNFTES